ncbi:hypothetical protein HDU67_005560 [Dinochytrium kinnereticum]|nr:hypothetical protein HDU67_005560 [Dinochytrium kinnereticum]
MDARNVGVRMNRQERLNMNIIISQIKLNALLSEKEGVDYIGHFRNRKHLRQIVENLKTALFYFSGSAIVEEASISLKNALEEGLRKLYLEGFDSALLARIIKCLEEAERDEAYKKIQRGEKIMYFTCEYGISDRRRIEQLDSTFSLSDLTELSSLSLIDSCLNHRQESPRAQLAANSRETWQKKRENVNFMEDERFVKKRRSSVTEANATKCEDINKPKTELADVNGESDSLNQTRQYHVLGIIIMDITEGSFGIDLSSASRIYFLRPVSKESVFRQAIKRAHRIGSTERVYVETLYFEGSLEESQLFEKDKTALRATKISPHSDDLKMIEIVEKSPFIDLGKDCRY